MRVIANAIMWLATKLYMGLFALALLFDGELVESKLHVKAERRIAAWKLRQQAEARP